MPYDAKAMSAGLTRILFPIVVTVIAGLVAPASVALVGFLMFGNLLRECGVLNSPEPRRPRTCWPTSSPSCWGITVAGQMHGGPVRPAGRP